MARFLVNIATGPENPTRAALGLLVAKTAAAEGHDVTVFLAGDAVGFARAETAAAAQGIGTGPVAEHLSALRKAGATVYLSGMSSKARGVDAAASEGFELAPPEKLVELAASAETVLVY
jgi:uncharacterized protein